MISKYKFAFFFLSIIITIFSIYFYINEIKTNKVVNQNTYFFIKKNANQKTILNQLKLKNITISYLEWRVLQTIRYKKFIPKAGEYLILKNSTISQIQDIFQKGKTITRSFTLIEGSSAAILKKKIMANKYLTGTVPHLKEGIYKPDTYYFKYGYSRIKLLKRMKLAQDEFLKLIWQKKPKKFILKNKNELLILASMVQSESNSLKDSKLVASVFINRLTNNMKLQSDVTLAYGLNISGKELTRKMLKLNHPFNTYYHKGLPPTPISYPGENAFRSLKNIKKTDYFYFVSDGRGGHRFAKTYSLHKKNIKLWKDNKLRGK